MISLCATNAPIDGVGGDDHRASVCLAMVMVMVGVDWRWRILDIASAIGGRSKDEFASGMAPWWEFIDNLIWHLRSLIVMIVFILILLFS